MKRLCRLIHIVMGAFVGVWMGHSAYVVWDVSAHPQRYAAQSAPWYTDILVRGAFTLAVVLICLAAKAIIRRKSTK